MLDCEGRLIVEFTVLKDGKVADPKIVRQADCREIGQEMIRVFLHMPPWTPAKKNGIPVDMTMTLPIGICLE
jgi:hypothetical protein